MLEKNRFALKEWAIIEAAMCRGRQIFMLRNGGLADKNSSFSVEHSEFFIYPTIVHQQRKGIVPAWMAELENLMAAPGPSEMVTLSCYGVVDRALKISDIDCLRRLSHYHIYNEQEIRRRFFHRGSLDLHLVILRVYRLPEPYHLPVQARYAGCRSWVDLGREFSTIGCRPALDDLAFKIDTRNILATAAGRTDGSGSTGTA